MNSISMNNNSMLSSNTQSIGIMKVNNISKDNLMIKEINKLSICIKSMYKNIKQQLLQYKLNTNKSNIAHIQTTLEIIDTHLTSFANEAKTIFNELKQNRKSISQIGSLLHHQNKPTNTSLNNTAINKSSLLHSYSVLSPSGTNSKVLSSSTNSPLIRTWNNDKEKESFMSYRGNFLNQSGSYNCNNNKRSNSSINNSSTSELNHLLGTIKHICKCSSVKNGLIKSRNNESPLNKRKVILGLLENVANVYEQEKHICKGKKSYMCKSGRSSYVNRSLNESGLNNNNNNYKKGNKEKVLYEDNTNEMKMLRKELDNKKEIIYKLKQELNEGSVKKLNEKIKGIEKEIQVKNERIKELEVIEKMFISKSNTKYKRTRNVNKKCNNNNSITHSTIEIIKDVDNVNKDKQKGIELTQQLQCQIDIINTLHNNNNNSSNRCININNNNTDEVYQLKTEIQSQHTFIEQLKQHYESQLNAIKFHLNTKTQETQSLQNEINALNQTIQSLTKQIRDEKPVIINKDQSELIRNVEILKKENEKFVKENAKLRNDLMLKTNSYLTLQNKYNKEKTLLEKETKDKMNKLNDMKTTLKHKCEMLVNQASFMEKVGHEKNELEQSNVALSNAIKLKEETINMLLANNKELLKEKELLVKQLKKYHK